MSKFNLKIISFVWVSGKLKDCFFDEVLMNCIILYISLALRSNTHKEAENDKSDI